uniref:(northern house mosquito) hypothetical protein n=1 Tax=Culex pipiens TaxID=7175 RepID=A0A8D8F982_CULPI
MDSAQEQSEMEYDDYEETEYLRDPVNIDYDPFADERVDAESTEDDSVEDGNGSKDDQGEEVQVEGEPSTEITAAMETAVQPEENKLCQHLASQVTDRRDSDHE